MNQIRTHLSGRHQFDPSLAEFQGLRWRIGRLASRLERPRLLTYAAAVAADVGSFPSAIDAADAKLAAVDVADASLQLPGWRGIVHEPAHHAELNYGQMRGWTIGGGTSESLLNTVAAAVLRTRTS